MKGVWQQTKLFARLLFWPTLYIIIITRNWATVFNLQRVTVMHHWKPTEWDDSDLFKSPTTRATYSAVHIMTPYRRIYVIFHRQCLVQGSTGTAVIFVRRCRAYSGPQRPANEPKQVCKHL